MLQLKGQFLGVIMALLLQKAITYNYVQAGPKLVAKMWTHKSELVNTRGKPSRPRYK